MTSGGGRGNSKYKGPGAGTCQGVCEEELPGKRGGKSSKGAGTCHGGPDRLNQATLREQFQFCLTIGSGRME